jgi:hypothetical protein
MSRTLVQNRVKSSDAHWFKDLEPQRYGKKENFLSARNPTQIPRSSRNRSTWLRLLCYTGTYTCYSHVCVTQRSKDCSLKLYYVCVCLRDRYKRWGEFSVVKNTKGSHKHPTANGNFRVKTLQQYYKLQTSSCTCATNILRTNQHIRVSGYILSLILCNMPWVTGDSMTTAEGFVHH